MSEEAAPIGKAQSKLTSAPCCGVGKCFGCETRPTRLPCTAYKNIGTFDKTG